MTDPETIWLEAVRTSVLLRHLAPNDIRSLRTSCKVSKVRAQMSMYRQGAFADCFYVVQSGRFRATIGTGDVSAREYGQCQTFGSHEILFPQPRTASITCVEGGAVWVIEKRVFQSKLAGETIASGLPAPELVEFVRGVSLFNDLDDEHIAQLSRAANEETIAPEQLICSQGDQATTIYVVKSGSVVTSQTDSTYQYTMKPPEFTGESALYPEEELRTRKASCSATGEGAVVLSFNVVDIESVIGFALQEQAVRTYNRKLLCSVRFDDRMLTEGLDELQIDMLVDSLREEQYNEGFILAQEGKVDHTLYIIKRGRASIYKASVGEVAHLVPGDFFGEMCLVERRTTRSATIVARGNPTLTLLELSAEEVLDNPDLDEWRAKLIPAEELSPAEEMSDQSTSVSFRRPPPKRRLSFAERIAETQAEAYRAAAIARKERAKAARKQHEIDMAILEGKLQIVLKPQGALQPGGTASKIPPAKPSSADAFTLLTKTKRPSDENLASDRSSSTPQSSKRGNAKGKKPHAKNSNGSSRSPASAPTTVMATAISSNSPTSTLVMATKAAAAPPSSFTIADGTRVTPANPASASKSTSIAMYSATGKPSLESNSVRRASGPPKSQELSIKRGQGKGAIQRSQRQHSHRLSAPPTRGTVLTASIREE